MLSEQEIIDQKRSDEYQEMLNGYWDAVKRIYYLLNTYNHWSEEGTFTFPDGLTINKDDPMSEVYK